MSNLYSRLCAGVLGGLAALVVACGPNSDDKQDASVPDANYSQADAGCNPNCYVDGGESADGGYVNQVPIVVAYTIDSARTQKTEFKLGEMVFLRIDGTIDPDCDIDTTCETTQGIDYCTWSTSGGGRGIVFPGRFVGNSYDGQPRNITYTLRCFENRTRGQAEQNRPFGEGSTSINLVQ